MGVAARWQKAAKVEADKHNMKIFGANVWWCFDCGWEDGSIIQEMKEQVRLTKLMVRPLSDRIAANAMDLYCADTRCSIVPERFADAWTVGCWILQGGEYVSFQMWLKPEAMGDCGAYRRDEPYLDEVARRIEKLHQICFEQGMNCYIETHVGRVTEDPEAFCKIMDRCRVPFETNGDLSHYVYRGLRSEGAGAEDVGKILAVMGHTHQRMARDFGDLSAVVDDPASDWEDGGMTFRAFEFSKPGLRGGLSSRVICGESGPMHLQTDPMSQDAKLVPLWRAMATYADLSARGLEPTLDSPDDMRPWK